MVGRLTRHLLAHLTGYQPMTDATYHAILRAIREEAARVEAQP